MGKGRLEAFTDGVIAIMVLLLERTIIARSGRNSKLAAAVGSELKANYRHFMRPRWCSPLYSHGLQSGYMSR